MYIFLISTSKTPINMILKQIILSVVDKVILVDPSNKCNLVDTPYLATS
jgi:hypothetical protein